MKRWLAIALTVLGCLVAGRVMAQGYCPTSYGPAVLIGDVSYQVKLEDGCKLLVFTASASIAVSLPDPSVTLPAGWTIAMKANGVGTATLTPANGKTIDGFANRGIATGTGVQLWHNGANYYSITSAVAGSAVSVGLTAPASSLFSVTGSPVLAVGTLGLTTTGISGGLPYFDTVNTLNSSGLLTGNRLVLGGGVGSPPTTLGSSGTLTTLLHGNASGPPSFGAVANADLVNSSMTVNTSTCTLGLTCNLLTGASNTQVLYDSSGAIAGAALTYNGLTFTNAPSPVNPSDVANKAYVDSIAAGLTTFVAGGPTIVATTANLTATYANGASGVGATLTNSGTQAALAIDGVSLSTSQRVLVKDQTTTFQNGIYTVTTVGSGATNWVLTRSTDFDQAVSGEVVQGALVAVSGGSTNAGKIWVESGSGPFTIGATPIIWSVFLNNTYSAGPGITLTGSVFSLTSPVTLAHGGTNADLSATGGAGQVLQQSTPGANITVGQLAAGSLSNIAANTYLGNPTGSSAAPVATAIGSCSGNNHSLQYTTNTGPTCVTDVTNLDVADQVVTGGANVTSLAQSAGNITVDCGLRPAQYIPNTGAFTVTAPSADGYCYLDVENGVGAGAITLSGFSPNTMGGATLDTTNGHNFRLMISRVHAHSNIFAIALQ